MYVYLEDDAAIEPTIAFEDLNTGPPLSPAADPKSAAIKLSIWTPP